MDPTNLSFIRIDAADLVCSGDLIYPLVKNAPETKRPFLVLAVTPDHIVARNDWVGFYRFKYKQFVRAFEPSSRDD